MSSTFNPFVARLQRIWWLAPAKLFCLVIGGTMLASAWQSDAAYRLYGTPKYISLQYVLLAGTCIAAYSIGAGLAGITGTRPRPTSQEIDRRLIPWFWFSWGLTLFGYAVWLAVGVKNGFSLSILRELITTDEPAVGETIRAELFGTVQGITTCTQFGIAALLFGLWLFYRGQRQLFWPILLLLGLAAGRALVFSERLALIELLVPATIVAMRMRVLGRSLPATVHWLLKVAPVAAVLGLFLFFGAFEYFRSWRYYQHEFDSYPQFVVWRMAGYYTTAHNNSAMALETQPVFPLPYSTVQMLWRFPGLSKSPLGYQALTGVDPVERHNKMLERFGTPELNNEGGLFQPALDFGLGGLVVFWAVCGFVGGRLYLSYLAGTIAGVTLYPLVFLAILETPRFLYLTYPRSLPTLLMLVFVLTFVIRSRPTAAFSAALPAPVQ